MDVGDLFEHMTTTSAHSRQISNCSDHGDGDVDEAIDDKCVVHMVDRVVVLFVLLS